MARALLTFINITLVLIHVRNEGCCKLMRQKAIFVRKRKKNCELFKAVDVFIFCPAHSNEYVGWCVAGKTFYLIRNKASCQSKHSGRFWNLILLTQIKKKHILRSIVDSNSNKNFEKSFYREFFSSCVFSSLDYRPK